jgi:hypothetical protein
MRNGPLDVATSISEEGRFFPETSRKANSLKQAEQFEDDYNDNNYSNYVEDVSVHAVTNIRLGCGGQHLYMISQYSQRLAPGKRLRPLVELRAKLRR